MAGIADRQIDPRPLAAVVQAAQLKTSVDVCNALVRSNPKPKETPMQTPEQSSTPAEPTKAPTAKKTCEKCGGAIRTWKGKLTQPCKYCREGIKRPSEKKAAAKRPAKRAGKKVSRLARDMAVVARASSKSPVVPVQDEAKPKDLLDAEVIKLTQTGLQELERRVLVKLQAARDGVAMAAAVLGAAA